MMGNILGFIIPIALAITQPQLFGIAFKRLHKAAVASRDHATIWGEVFRSILVRVFGKLALLALVVELVLAVFIGYSVEQTPWYGWLIAIFLTAGQGLWALLNYRSAARVTSTRKVCGKETTTADPVYPFWAKLSKYVYPLTWLALTSIGFLAQGGLLEYHALANAPGYSYGDQRVIILLGFLSKVMYGIMAIATSSILGWLVVKGTRFLERASTVIAKMIVSIDLNIEFNKNALQEIGGEIDFLDEEEVAGKIKYLFTVLFIPLIIFDIAIFAWPSPMLATLILFSITAVGLLEIVFSSFGEGPKAEAKQLRIDRTRVVFRTLPFIGGAVIFLAYVMQTVTGRNAQVEAENIWYGLTGVPIPGFWICTGFGVAAFALYLIMKKIFKVVSEFVKNQDAKPATEGGVGSFFGRIGLYTSATVLVASGLAAFLLFVSAFVSLFSDGEYRFSTDPNQEALTLHAVKANGHALPPVEDKVWHVKAVSSHRDGNVNLEFDSTSAASGVVEFFLPLKELDTEEVVQVQITAANHPNPKTGLYHHTASFQVPKNFSGKYSIVMESPQNVKNTRVNGQVAKAIPHDLWELPAPDATGRVTAEFWTKKRAYGVVEFSPPEAAFKAGIYFPVSVQTTPVEQKVEKDDEEVTEVVAYKHSVDFVVPEDFSGKYRIVMRNADRTAEVNPSYGKVVQSAEHERTLPQPPGRWERFCAWWHNLWTWDDSPNPPRTVVVHRYEPRARPAAAPRSTGCKVKPLKVPPSLREEVAAARRN